MEQRLSLITLGVKDIQRARAFYDAMGWKAASEEHADTMVPYNLQNTALGLFSRESLAEDAKVSSEGSGFRGVALAYNVREKNDVVEILQEAEKAGGTITKPAQDVFWGGYCGYFTDPDGHLWEVAWNPFSKLGKDGAFQWGGVEHKEEHS